MGEGFERRFLVRNLNIDGRILGLTQINVTSDGCAEVESFTEEKEATVYLNGTARIITPKGNRKGKLSSPDGVDIELKGVKIKKTDA